MNAHQRRVARRAEIRAREESERVEPHSVVDDDCDDVPCWCGEPHPYYDADWVGNDCDGSGSINCECGGDLCVCHHHGEIACPGCDACDNADAPGYGADCADEDLVP